MSAGFGSWTTYMCGSFRGSGPQEHTNQMSPDLSLGPRATRAGTARGQSQRASTSDNAEVRQGTSEHARMGTPDEARP